MIIRVKKHWTVVDVLALLIFLTPFLWLLGVIPFVYQMTVLFLLLVSIHRIRFWKGLRLSFEVYILTVFIAVYVTSILFNLSSIPFQRLLGTTYNLTFWIQGLAIIVLLNSMKINMDDIGLISRSVAFLGNFCGATTLLGLFLWFLGKQQVEMQSLFFSRLPPMIRESIFGAGMSTSMIYTDFTSWGVMPRSSAFAPYATAFGMMMLITIPFTVNYFHQKKGIRNAWLWISLILQVGALLLSLSRSAMVGLFIGGVLVFLKFTFHRPLRILGWGTIFFVVFSTAIIGNTNIVQKLMSFRQGSTTKRLYMYKTAAANVLERPLIGFGYKPKTEELGVPLASHSTVVSVFYRTGFLGLFSIGLLWMSVAFKWLYLRRSRLCNSETRTLGVVFFSGLFWQMTDDLDAPQTVAFLYFIVVGLIVSLWKDQVRNKQNGGINGIGGA